MRSFIEYHGNSVRSKIECSGEGDLRVHRRKDTPKTQWDGVRMFFAAIFLPQGYPESVSSDYISYQLWDTIQAFCSSIVGALATEAVLKGAGVGDQTASALAASLTWLLKDGFGMVGRILFSYFKGSSLDCDCKKWRFMADILNDLAFFVDLLSPYITSYFTVSACISSLLRCVVGVAGGATRTTIAQHQARRGNLADVSAKDGSQETLVNVIALITSLILLPAVSGKTTIVWTLFIILTGCHLLANWLAVRSLRFDTLNAKRAAIICREYLQMGVVPGIDEVNCEEPLFYNMFPSRTLGCPLTTLLRERELRNADLVEDEKYLFVVDRRRNHSWIAMKKGSNSEDELRAFFHVECFILGKPLPNWESLLENLHHNGWRTDETQLSFNYWTYEVIE